MPFAARTPLSRPQAGAAPARTIWRFRAVAGVLGYRLMARGLHLLRWRAVGAVMPSNGNGLREELAYFEANRAKWLGRYEGQYTVIKGDQVAGFFPTLEEAYEEGLVRFGHVPMLVR